MVNRLIEPTSGQVVVRGRPTAEWDPIALRRSIGYVIQEGGLMPHLTILENVALAAKVQGRARAEQARAGDVSAGAGRARPAAGSDRSVPRQLSGGQRQRVGVARALAASPDLILMDEPFGALDPITRRELQDEFRSLQRRLGTTVVLVTHDIREACRLGDRLALMDHGRAGPGRARRPSSSSVRPTTSSAQFFREAAAVDAATEPRAVRHELAGTRWRPERWGACWRPRPPTSTW